MEGRGSPACWRWVYFFQHLNDPAIMQRLRSVVQHPPSVRALSMLLRLQTSTRCFVRQPSGHQHFFQASYDAVRHIISVAFECSTPW